MRGVGGGSGCSAWVPFVMVNARLSALLWGAQGTRANSARFHSHAGGILSFWRNFRYGFVLAGMLAALRRDTGKAAEVLLLMASWSLLRSRGEGAGHTDPSRIDAFSVFHTTFARVPPLYLHHSFLHA